MIIGIAGTIGSGKGTVVEYLKSKGFARYSSSGILGEILRKRGLPETREHMSLLADELMDTYPGGILHLSHERAQKEGAQNYILEAIHRVSEAEYLHSIEGVLLGVDADIEKRYARIQERHEGKKDQVTYEQFREDALREDEGARGAGNNIRATLALADSIVMNNGSKEELEAQVEEVLNTLR